MITRLAFILLTCLGAGAASADPILIGNDRGGVVSDRLTEIRQIRASGRAVQIRGQVCFSTCTMYLGLPDVCILPGTVFGFHGPTASGRKLDKALFDRASALISAHYPPALRNWYMNDARHTLHRVRRVSGATLIDLGVAPCDAGR